MPNYRVEPNQRTDNVYKSWLYDAIPFPMARGINIYSELLIPRIRILDISNSE